MISRGNKWFYRFFSFSILLHLGIFLFPPFQEKKDSEQELFIPLGICSEDLDCGASASPVQESADMIDPDKALGLEQGRDDENIDYTGLTELYLELVRKKIEENKFFPEFTRNIGLIGNVKIAFEIHPDGRFKKVRVIRSSGSSRLDTTALKAVFHMGNRIKRPRWAGREILKTAFTIKYQYNL